MAALDQLRRALRAGGFRGTVSDDAATRTVYGTDNSIYQLQPAGAVIPSCYQDLVTLASMNSQLEVPFELVARGGGTGTNGQSLTNGLVVDMRRALNRIVSIDIDAQEAVVQPGTVLGQLNSQLADKQVFFAPHVSTSSRATIGGMVATDAAGRGSLVHGRTNKHVLELQGVLADGTEIRFARRSRAEVEGVASGSGRLGGLYRELIDATSDTIADDFPAVPRGFTGYNLADVHVASEDSFDFTKLICGSEGTLALVSEIRIRLTQLAQESHLAVVSYPTFAAAIRDANALKITEPTAIECLDNHTLGMAAASPAWPHLATLLDPTGYSLLLLEYDDAEGVSRLQDLLPTRSEVKASAITSDLDVIGAIWKVRADAVGLLAQPIEGTRSVAFVEDCAVPPHHLESFVSGFKAILDGHRLRYGMYGHADVGCVHVRPALDLLRPEHEALVRTVTDEVASLVETYGGVLWGEHGRGFRGEYLNLPECVVDKMRTVKTAFDPRNILNPGKLYVPFPSDGSYERRRSSLVAIDATPLRATHDRVIALQDRNSFHDAFSCNGNGVCHHWGAAEVMCPSFKVTLDPRLSPKGRADLIRAWLTDPDDGRLRNDVAESLHQCLSCSACTGRCPVQVDIPEMKSLFLETNPERSVRLRIRNSIVSNFEALLPTVQPMASRIGGAQRLLDSFIGPLLGLVDLPTVPIGSVKAELAALGVEQMASADQPIGMDGPDDPTLVIVPDAFTYFLEPRVLLATVRILLAIGERPVIGPFVPSGKFDHVKGRRQRFATTVAKQRQTVDALSRSGRQLVVIEPAAYLLHHHEYPQVDPGYPAQAVGSATGYIERRLEPAAGRERGRVQLFQHCTEASMAPDAVAHYRGVLEKVGFTVETESSTCCGMAGVFGHEAENETMSRTLFDTYWRPRLEAAGSVEPVARCASGYSCRSQARRVADVTLEHPLVILALALCPPTQTAGGVHRPI